MDNNAWWYADGRWVHPNEATLSVNDIAVLRGYSVFESMRTYDRRPFHLDEHLLRLYRSAALIELDIPWSRQYIADVVRETIARNSYRHAAIRLLVTGGGSGGGGLASCEATLVLLISPFWGPDK